jgi:hypothetical protein
MGVALNRCGSLKALFAFFFDNIGFRARELHGWLRAIEVAAETGFSQDASSAAGCLVARPAAASIHPGAKYQDQSSSGAMNPPEQEPAFVGHRAFIRSRYKYSHTLSGYPVVAIRNMETALGMPRDARGLFAPHVLRLLVLAQ